MSDEVVAYDPYALPADAIQEPPATLWEAFRKTGPGIILAGTIVGSGELILTTGLGAKYGFVFLWLILFSCVIKVSFFTVLTVCAAAVLIATPGAFSSADVREGLSFQLPSDGLATAIAVFGITGVGATELVMYPYWCIEKGYARFTGPRDDSAAWLQRAKGWIRVMHLDIACSMVIYTAATLAFYLLGAGVLHRAGLVPAGSEMIVTLSRLYTATLGEWALWLFYAGAVITLYGTIFASTAAHARVTADLVRMAGGFARDDAAARARWRDINTVLLAVLPAVCFWIFGNPVRMVVAGGIAQAVMLPLIGLAAVYLRHARVPKELRPSPLTTAALWVSAIVMVVATSITVLRLFRG